MSGKCLPVGEFHPLGTTTDMLGRSQHLGFSEVGEGASGITDEDGMFRKTVSVIIPYNRASQTVARARESALGQTVRPYEIIVVAPSPK
jgi:hypothetical protein